MECEKELFNYFSEINQKYHYREDLSASDMKNFDSLFRVKKGVIYMKYYYLEDELINMLDEYRREEDVNLTHIYIMPKKVLFHMKHRRLMDKWHSFKNKPAKQQVLEQAVALIMQWTQLKARVTTKSISSTLEHFRETIIRDALANRIPHIRHSLYLTNNYLFGETTTSMIITGTKWTHDRF